MDNKQTFNYTYSAKEQEEIKAIRQKYDPAQKQEDPMEALRRLDAAVTQKATSLSIAFGILGALILGSGMSLAMTDIGAAIGLGSGMAMLIGIAVGTLGIILVSAAYPLYNKVIKSERKRIAPEIIRLTDELLK